MWTYVDASVLLRIVFHEPNHLEEFSSVSHSVSSELLRVECLRTVDRVRIHHQLSEDVYLQRVDYLYHFLEGFELVPLHREILNRASQPFSTRLGTLDAIHLATAFLYRERIAQDLVFATHDTTLKTAARAIGFATIG